MGITWTGERFRVVNGVSFAGSAVRCACGDEIVLVSDAVCHWRVSIGAHEIPLSRVGAECELIPIRGDCSQEPVLAIARKCAAIRCKINMAAGWDGKVGGQAHFQI